MPVLFSEWEHLEEVYEKVTVYSRRSITIKTQHTDDLWSFRRCVESNLLLLIKCQHLQIIPLLILRNYTFLITDMMTSVLLIYFLSCFLGWEIKMVAYSWFLPYMGSLTRVGHWSECHPCVLPRRKLLKAS